MWKKDDSRGAKLDEKSLWSAASAAQTSVLKVRRSHDAAIDQSIWEQTLQEVEEGGLRGPYTQAELSKLVGPLWIAARRFGIQQGEKIRPIDNFAEYQVNDAFGSKEKVALHCVDNVVAWSRAWLEAVDKIGKVYLEDSAGAGWSGRLHGDWAGSEWTDLKGRVTDLENAYK